MSTICIIPARGGSTRIPMKNINLFHGKPIICYSIEAAQKSGLFDRIIVSTDHVDIAAVAQMAGAEVWRRASAYGANEVGTQEVTRECLLGIGADQFDIVCCLYATAPLMDIADLKRGYRAVRHGGDGAAYAFSVNESPLFDAGQFYWGAAGDFMYGTSLVGLYTRLIVVDDKRVCDINTLDDWERALRMYEELHA